MGPGSLLAALCLCTLAAVTLSQPLEAGIDAAGSASAPVGAGEAAPPPRAPTPRTPGDPTKLLNAAEREFRAKAYEASLRLFGEALAAAPPGDAALRARILYARHKAFMSQQRLPQAIADLTAVCDLDAKHVLARLQRANLQLMTGRCAEAVADYGAVLALDSSKRDAHARMPHAAECKAALERADRARAAHQNEALRDALTDAIAEGRATSAPALLMERALVYIQLRGEDNNANALADLARVLKMDPNNVPAYALRGRALMLHGDFATGASRGRSPPARAPPAPTPPALLTHCTPSALPPRPPLSPPPFRLRSARALPGWPQDGPRAL